MKSFYFLILAFIISSTLKAQSLYEAGYFIDNDGKKTEALIKKLPWRTNPTEFTWKKTISSSPQVAKVEDIKEFAVGEEFLFKRYILEFDLNGDTLGRSTKSEDPNLKIRKIFLRVILQSKATLYQYSFNNVHRFFYTDEDTFYPELLIYKVFYVPDDTKKPGKKIIGKENETYKEQLAKELKCGDLNPERLTYTQTDLKRYFRRYNECKGYEIEYNIRKKINQTRVGIVAAVDLTTFNHNSRFNEDQTVFYEDQFVPRYGIYIESFIPFSKVDLSFFLEATYKEFSTTGRDENILNEDYTMDYVGINVALAPRFHIYLSPKFVFFLEGGINVDFDLGTEFNELSGLDDLENSTTNYFYGGGFGTGRFKVGFRQYTDRNISRSTRVTESELGVTSLYLAFKLF